MKRNKVFEYFENFADENFHFTLSTIGSNNTNFFSTQQFFKQLKKKEKFLEFLISFSLRISFLESMMSHHPSRQIFVPEVLERGSKH